MIFEHKTSRAAGGRPCAAHLGRHRCATAPPEKQTNSACAVEKEIYYKELARAVMESGKSKIRSTGQQAGDSGGDGQMKSESCLLGTPLGRPIFFFFF